MTLPLPSHDPHPLKPGLWRTDAFHRQPLFLVEPAPGDPGPARVVRTWNEAHALHGSARPTDIDPAYVAALISGHRSAAAAPYRRIRRLPRAHQVFLAADGELRLTPFDPLAGGAGPMEAEALHRHLRQGLLDHVRQALDGHDGPIGCEHSSGLDSNAVLGALIHGLGLPPERLRTWSLEGAGEGPVLDQCRPFFGLPAAHCQRGDPAAQEGAAAADLLQQQLRLLGAPAQIGGHPGAVAALRHQGCTLLFSGFGGDQALSHNANNVPTDLFLQGRWPALRRWMGGRRAALRTAGGRALALACRPWAERQVRRRSRRFWSSDLLERALTEDGRAWLSPHLSPPYPWEIDGYLRQHTSIRRRVLADWVAVRVEEETRLAAALGLAKAFPLLDERLIATLLRQDPLLFGEGPGRGRLLHRRAFAPFLPPVLRDNPTKQRTIEGGLATWRVEVLNRHRRAMAHHLEGASSWPPALARWWDLNHIRQEAETILERSVAAAGEPDNDEGMRAVVGTSRALETMALLSGWWDALDG